ncbi:MAG: mntD [Chitinophagaceae bacterium]|nr:mntD [Chitinophagaceae bacterium]
MSSFWIILTGILVVASCSILGCFLVLRKMTMVGDAISHAVLPGIVLAYLVSGERNSIFLITGAALIGLLTTFLIEFLHKKAKVQEDASIGITFTSFFALGVILISYFAENVDLDQDCVLYGEIAYVTLDPMLIGNIEYGPKAVWLLAFVFLVVLAVIIPGYRSLSLTTFDPNYAQAIGISVTLWHYVLMSLVSLTTVASFESVGAILVVAFLTVPAATAYLLTEKLKNMILLSILFGVLASISGYYLADWSNGSIAGAMATAAGMIFGIVFIGKRIQRKWIIAAKN